MAADNIEQFIVNYNSLLHNAMATIWSETVKRLPARLRNRIAPLPCPTFCLVPNLGKWGCWVGSPVNRIELDASLLTEHSWPAAVEILRHETAHQITEALYGQDIASHGNEFRKICSMVGANFRSRVLNPDDWTTIDDTTEINNEQVKAIQKIQKLLALSCSTNMNEAEQALSKACELAEKYAVPLQSIADNEKDEEREMGLITLGPVRGQIDMIESEIGNLLADFYHVLYIWNYVPNYQPERQGVQMTIYGDITNLKIAKYVYDCLERFLDVSWLQHLIIQGHHVGRFARRDYCLGVLLGFSSSLRERERARQRKPETSSNTALILAYHQELDDFFHSKNPHIRHTRGRNLKINRGHHEAGYEAGRNFSINPGMENGLQRRKLLN